MHLQNLCRLVVPHYVVSTDVRMDSIRTNLSFYGGTLGQTNAMGEDSFWNIEEIGILCGCLAYGIVWAVHYTDTVYHYMNLFCIRSSLRASVFFKA